MEADLASNIDDILNDKVTDDVEAVEPKESEAELQEATEVVEQSETESPEETVEAESTGKFEKKATGDDPEVWTKAAYLDEKGKRQRLQGELDEQNKSYKDMQTQLSQYQTQQAPTFIDPLDDAQGFANQQQQSMQQMHMDHTVRMSRMLAVKEHGKELVDEATAAFTKAGATDPVVRVLADRFMKTDDPVTEVINWHKQQNMQAEIGNDPAAYRERVKAELMAEMNTEETQEPSINPQTMPSNFASANSKGKRKGPGWSGPKSLGDILA